MDLVNITPETTSIPTQDKPASKKLRSSVWEEFKKIKVNRQDKAECIWCKKRLSGTATNETNHLRGHLKGCIQKKIKTRNHDKGQPFIMPTILEGKEELGIGTYNPENVKKLIAEAIIMHDYPLSIVDHVGLRRVFVALQPLFKVPTRNTIKNEVLKVYDFEKKCAMKMLDSHQGRVAITTDMWTASNQKKGYMAVTAHYIDGSWTLQSRILRFIYVPAPHTSERLGDALVNCLMEWNIDSKLYTARQLRIGCTRKLALDCPTRWNSTYKMLDIAIEYKDVFIRLKLKRCDPLYTCLPTNEQWQFAKDICKIKLAIEEWKNSSNSIIAMMATKMMEKFQNYWSDVHDMMGVAAVLDPTKKMAVLDFWFPKLYGQDSSAQVSRIKELCYGLLYDYQQTILRDAQPTSPPTIGTTTVLADDESEFAAYIDTIAENSSSSVNGVVYPTLQAIARDVLAIPISTVASESAFSTSGRILSPHRSRLNWTTVEALMCARSWLWAAENDGTSRVAQEYATVLNEMESDDEAELMESSLGYHFED
ncbi:hypothetical protein TSUD_329690 [Trifolium subterraneum]|nr:hypothetical protein TSUD_329690 [Trifolium subterraneum]